ncbi:hypothetical protein MMC18_003293 [Xylographa bjoerkii]|nr:hypothetical protein [Xylographa bjoerkii]
MAKAPTTLLSLPPEILDMIYELCLVPDDNSEAGCLEVFWVDKSGSDLPHHAHPPLLQVHRDLSCRAAAIYYSRKLFRIVDCDVLVDWLYFIGALGRDHVRRIEIYSWESRRSHRYVDEAARMLALLPSLTTLGLRYIAIQEELQTVYRGWHGVGLSCVPEMDMLLKIRGLQDVLVDDRSIKERPGTLVETRLLDLLKPREADGTGCDFEEDTSYAE